MVERVVGSTSSTSNIHEVGNENSNPYRNMVMDAMRISEGNVSESSIVEEEPNADAARFFDLLKDYDELLWDGCSHHSKLLVVAQVFTIKSDHGLSEAGYDKIIEWAEAFYLSNMELVCDGSRVAKPRASFVLEKNAQLLVYKWLKSLRFPDGYASNISRLVNTKK